MTEAEAAKEKGNSAFKNNDYNKAIEHYTSAISHNPMEPTYYNNRAAAYMKIENYQLALYDCNEALNINPNLIKSLLRAGKCQYKLGYFKESITLLQKALVIEPLDAEGKQCLAESSYLSGQEDEYNIASSKNDFGKSRDIMNIITKYCIGIKWVIEDIRLHMRMGENDQAMTKINANHFKLPKNDRIILSAQLYYQKGQTENAKKILQDSLKMDPDAKDVQQMLKNIRKMTTLKEEANKYFKEGNYDKAITIYSEILDVEIQNRSLAPVILTNRAISYSKKKDNDNALADLGKALDINPTYSKASFKKGELLLSMGKPEEARYAFEDARRNGTEFDVDEKVRQCQEEEKRARKKDHYKTLGLTNKATDEEIKSSYRKLALMYHPDKQRNKSEKDKKENEAKFKEIATAYSVLSNVEKRKRYDMGMDDEDGSGFSNINPMDIFGHMFGGGFPDMFGGSEGGHKGGHTFFSFGAPNGFNNSTFKFNFG